MSLLFSFLILFKAFLCLDIHTPRPAADLSRGQDTALIDALKTHVRYISESIGPRSKPASLNRAAAYIETSFKKSGLRVWRQPFNSGSHKYENVCAFLPGKGPAWVIGAHYDTVPGSPGADDNASSLAVLLELAKSFKPFHEHPLYLVAFANEETRQTTQMGSYQFVKQLNTGDTAGMICLEMVGYYNAAPHSQLYPGWLRYFYPSEGDFTALIGNPGSFRLLRSVGRQLKTKLKIRSAILPSFMSDVGRSDHINFWNAGIPAVLITDTADYRNFNYHRATDSWQTLDYKRMALLTRGLSRLF